MIRLNLNMIIDIIIMQIMNGQIRFKTTAQFVIQSKTRKFFVNMTMTKLFSVHSKLNILSCNKL